MARKKSAEIKEKVGLTGLERLGLRVSAMIQSPISQLNRSVLIHRLDTDEDEPWDGVMGLLAETDGLNLLFDDDGNVMVSWDKAEGDDDTADQEEIRALKESEEMPF